MDTFEYSYIWPTFDWYEEKKVVLNKNDYTYYCLERRYDKRWWLIGKKFNDKEYTWTRKEIGPIGDNDLKKFIKWCEREGKSKITEIRAISGDFNLLKHIENLINLMRT